MFNDISLLNLGLQYPDIYEDIIDYYGSYISIEKKDIEDKIYHQFNYILIRNIPILLIIFLILCIILIFYTSYNNFNENTKLMLNKFCNLIMGTTIVIIGVYLITFRCEYRNKINIIKNYETEFNKILEINKMLKNQL
jgi:heme/copper-type cytochrome/quinol oxidase subunit 2